MAIQGGTLKEEVLITSLMVPSTYQAVEVRYNGSTGTGTGLAVDAQGYDEAIFCLHLGSISASATVLADVISCATDYIAGATPIGTFTSTASTLRRIFVNCKNGKRYLWMRTNQTQASNVLMSGKVIQSKHHILPEGGTYDATIGNP
jgi:hypothetical protein